MKITYYYKDTKMTVDQDGDYNNAELGELIRRMNEEPETIIVVYNDNHNNVYEGPLSGMLNWAKRRLFGLNEN
ncbi:hypothetical protein [Spirosoma endbachense]|uniref:Uncharacterized protein n=1 Tax=Spirosoma endbachense TaxID=2666025 RepID=A0A6P1W654_9BACT|nr:hypothetical protein [Spirosoma endbachense]QHV99206.1 hypothetical protein GJR95_31205 [Spirosoma endbachense]